MYICNVHVSTVGNTGNVHVSTVGNTGNVHVSTRKHEPYNGKNLLPGPVKIGRRINLLQNVVIAPSQGKARCRTLVMYM
jgi:hypothetical protein